VLLVVRVGEREVKQRLHVGALDPIDEISGLQARLRNLGYYEGEVDGRHDGLLAAALDEFRLDAGLSPGAASDSTLFDALEREHKV
jgi:peptidoglycan hydrolase-like protein with peptidoglycan-binding domain